MIKSYKEYLENISILQLENEVWKPIENCDNKYFISNFGRIKSKAKKEEIILKVQLTNRGYVWVGIHYKGQKMYDVHRLVAKYFVDNPNNYPEVNHLDGNKENNCYDNLEWCTRSQNNLHAYRTGLRANKKFGEAYNAKKVYQYDLDGNYIAEYSSTTEIAKKLSCCPSGISQCATGVLRSSHGFIFRYYKQSKIDIQEYKEILPLKVKQYDKQGNFIKRWNSVSEAANYYKIDNSSIYACSIGKKQKTAGGYIWKTFKEH